MPVSIVRPSIIESALAEPRPGWIRGFRMAEPVIISYARGLLQEFPGVPEGTVDVIPVDLVVAAIIEKAAAGPPQEPEIVQVASGSANPLRYRRPRRPGEQLVHRASPLRRRGPAHRRAGMVFPRPGPGAAPARAGQERHRAQREAAAVAPVARQAGSWSARLEERREEAERALAYVELYGAYAECEAIYGVDRLLARFDALDPADQRDFCFDPRVIDWEHYVQDVHLPSVVEHARVRTTPGGRVGDGARTGCAVRFCRPTGTSPRSTWRTR